MVDSGATFGIPDVPLRRSQPGGRRKPPPRRPENPPVIDITGAASPVEERPDDYPNRPAVYSTGQGGAEMYHYDRAAMANDQRAREMAQVKGPGQP